ncbi:hypothetical protein ACGF1Z_31245 [Streptomyces sp. NPDC048018]|uniref:hypothetical protein n=1 Tax=Streptomyces sp. NPDC048018 TaxID=3365499 RepID=UPI00371F01F5
MPYTVISLGGVATGLGIIVMFAIRWYFREGRSYIALIPFVFALLYGMLAALSAYNSFSALGAITWLGIWAGNFAGHIGLVWGVGGEDRDVTRATPLVLDSGGYVVLFLLTLVMIGLFIWARKHIPAGKIAAGALAGALLSLAGTIAGIAAVPLASAVNAIGSPITTYF